MQILAPAKINLFLEVVSKRNDGYHNLETIFQTVSLYDKIKILPQKNALSLVCSKRGIPKGRDNLALKAAFLLKEKLKVKHGAKIILEKNIPAGAGLGGGSSDAASVLKGLLKFWKKRIPKQELLKIAVKLGADVPFFLYGGTAFASGIGEKIKKINNVKPAWYLLIFPRFSIPTASVYKKLSFPLTKQQKITKIKKLLEAGSLPSIWGRLLFNRLEEPVLLNYAKIRQIKNELKNMGFFNLLSGSGSAVFALIKSRSEGEKIKSKFNEDFWDIWVVKTVP
ncbi:MAG: 4-(cytidine 5'-diphospho)-2-C-methyl-D-erythritol kinase [Endomicrobiales bacterium]|nr:4-(cytidine 5'-diphospho)-2-C-methyl-D-erythritol kinase [Endomicrobiales bacterium]